MNIHHESAEFEFGFASDVGHKRKGEPNQDALEVVMPDASGNWHPPLLIVADGLGKHFGGAIASQLVLQTFKREFKLSKHPANYIQLMEKCARQAHNALRIRGTKEPKLANMGSTIVAVALEEQKLHLLNVGDSRAYIMRGNDIRQISQDQSWVAEQMRAGILTEQEARTHPNRNRLNMAITAKRPEIIPYSSEEKFGINDIIVLCSDGLWGVIPETLIWAAASELPPQVAVKKLITLANNSQGPDNISVIIARHSHPIKKTAPDHVEDTNP